MNDGQLRSSCCYWLCQLFKMSPLLK